MSISLRSFFLRLLGIGCALTVAIIIAAGIYLQDANRLKPEIETLIAAHSGYTVHIEGELSWQLFPPLMLKATALRTEPEDVDLYIAELQLDMDLSAMWEDVRQWKIKRLVLTDVTLKEDTTLTHVTAFQVDEFQLDKAAPFSLSAERTTINANVSKSLPLTAQGLLTYTPKQADVPERIQLSQTRIETTPFNGLCDIDLANKDEFSTDSTASQAGILPLATLRKLNANLSCKMDQLHVGEATFANVNLDAINNANRLNGQVTFPEFLGGQANVNIRVDLTDNPTWTILPQISNVDSQQLMKLSNQSLQWIAPLAFSSRIQMQGNTPEALRTSITASSDFNGGQGQINIAKIRRQILTLATLAGREDKIAAWPETWDYQSLTGRWIINGRQHQMNLALDNMRVDAVGDYSFAANEIDLIVNVTLHEAAPDSPFQVNSTLQDTPIPIRCKGPASDPECKLDRSAAQNLIANALQFGKTKAGEPTTGLQEKLEEKIEDEVPEEYREAAKELLKLFGRRLRRD